MNDPRGRSQNLAYRHLGAVFFRRVEELGGQAFIKLQREGRFEEISWRTFGADVRDMMLGLDSLGLEKGDRVAILSRNRIEWLCADIACLTAGFPNVIISPGLSDGLVLKLLAHSRARAVFVEDSSGIQRLLNQKSKIPAVEHIFVMDPLDELPPIAIQFRELLKRGGEAGTDGFAAILDRVCSDDLATIVYTSGSTGQPKGVMKTQKNILSNYISPAGDIPLSKPEELTVLVLSLNHLLGRFGFHKSLVTGRRTAVVEATENDVDLETIRALSPTSVSLVPRVMEKIWEKILAYDGNRVRWEKIEKLHYQKKSPTPPTVELDGEHETLRVPLRESTRVLLGGRIKYLSYGGAPMPPTIIRFFELIGIPLLGGYGSTECGGVSLSGVGDNRPGSLGKPFPNVEVRIAHDGEILVRGPTVTPGYFEDSEATREVLDPDGWFHTGDLGTIDEDESLRIVGRKKDVFYCADGSNIYPGYIELLLENDPFIRQAVLLGDRRPFIAVLIVPDRARIAAELNLSETSLKNPEVEKMIGSRIQIINGFLEHYE
jgi:long-chain acyl-CoA synthetase